MSKQQREGLCDYSKGGSGEEMNWVTIQKQLPWSPESHGEGWNFIPCAIPLRGCKQRQCDPSGCFVYHYIFSRQESEHSSLPDC